MIRLLAVLFVCMFLYGVLAGFVGAALLALVMVGLCTYAERHFAVQDYKWAIDPANAPEAKQDTLHDLDTHECECMRAKDCV